MSPEQNQEEYNTRWPAISYKSAQKSHKVQQSSISSITAVFLQRAEKSLNTYTLTPCINPEFTPNDQLLPANHLLLLVSTPCFFLPLTSLSNWLATKV
jgi:hypothetical protein